MAALYHRSERYLPPSLVYGENEYDKFTVSSCKKSDPTRSRKGLSNCLRLIAQSVTIWGSSCPLVGLLTLSLT